MFAINTRTLQRWLYEYKKDGDLERKKQVYYQYKIVLSVLIHLYHYIQVFQLILCYYVIISILDNLPKLFNNYLNNY